MTPLGELRPARSILGEGVQQLKVAGVEHARQEAEWLLAQLIGVPRLALYLEETDVREEIAERFLTQIEARAMGIPLQYLLGEADFYGARFTVAPGVFIPRPETETIVDAALRALAMREHQLGRPLRLLDVGTGSGCIAVTLARYLPTCVVVGVELSWHALRMAQRNVQRYELASRICLVRGRWCEAMGGMFDGIISNPPYVPSAQVDHLPLDVRHEPRLSLDGGPDGMRDLVHVLDEAPRVLRPGGVVVLECGEEHVGTLLKKVRQGAWVDEARVLEDLATRPRGVLITRNDG